MNYLIVLIFLGIVIESMFAVGQHLNNDNEFNGRLPSTKLNDGDDSSNITTLRRPTGNNSGGRFRKVLKVKKGYGQESLPVVDGGNNNNNKLLNRTPSGEDSVPAGSNKNSFTVNNYDDNDDYFSRRRARFLFRQRVGK